jgi:hypothetical protein
VRLVLFTLSAVGAGCLFGYLLARVFGAYLGIVVLLAFVSGYGSGYLVGVRGRRPLGPLFAAEPDRRDLLLKIRGRDRND